MSRVTDFSFEDDDLVDRVEPSALPDPEPAGGGDVAPPEPAAAAAAAAAPVIVVRERGGWGLASRLTPPALILLAALAITSYQRREPVRYLSPRPRVEAADAARGGGPPQGPAAPDLVIRVVPSQDAAVTPTAEGGTGTAGAKGPGGKAAAAGTKGGADDPSPFDDPFAPPTLPPKVIARVIPFDPKPVKPAGGEPPRAADGRPAPPVAAAPDPARLAEAVPAAPKPQAVTNEDILRDIRREGEQKAAEKRALAALKPRIQAIERVNDEIRTQSMRATFHEDLKRALPLNTDLAVLEIERLCQVYGGQASSEVEEAYKRKLRTAPSRMSREARIATMRESGLPEPVIFRQLTSELARTMKTRGGPRDEKEVKLRAAQLLLNYPVRPERGSSPRASQPNPRPVAAARNVAPASRTRP